MMLSPKLSLLEVRLYDLLSAQFPDYLFRPDFDDQEFNLVKNKTYVVIKYLDDKMEGKIITTMILHPSYSMMIFTQSYLDGRVAMENISDYFDKLSAIELRGDSWAVTHFYRESQVAPNYDKDERFFKGQIDYRFHLTSAVY
jgi:hypothetical protein